MKRKFTEEDIEALLNKNKFINSENELNRIPIEKEVKLLDFIRQGKYKQLKIGNFIELEEKMGRAAKDRKRHFEYTTVAGITMFTRAAIEGGVRPDDAYDLADTMLQALERAKSIEEIQEIFELSGFVFAKAVYNARSEQRFYLIEQCKVYIERNIYKKIYLEDIASFVGLNPSYLSRIFSQKEGITIQEYIQKQKINAACDFLKFSNNSIADISQYMGFKSQSNFSAVFKKWKLTSPTNYRNKYKKEIYSKGNE